MLEWGKFWAKITDFKLELQVRVAYTGLMRSDPPQFLVISAIYGAYFTESLSIVVKGP